ncbi:hypothetical protein PROFUN_03903 [Planoprotostelium fungivorum]|uniref:Peptidase M48 domain-containing protein n=1 Tax=Planoprotostelium fungivorum TaxID=1890364 RepID=A0A2P6MTQ3_9EUKA|nr:hypothetical protein PROFUN_03903 [Planoprotostelium fungivorum]
MSTAKSTNTPWVAVECVVDTLPFSLNGSCLLCLYSVVMGKSNTEPSEQSNLFVLEPHPLKSYHSGSKSEPSERQSHANKKQWMSWYAKMRRYIAITILVIVSLTVIYITVEGDYMTIVERHREAQLIGPETEALIAEKAFNYLYGKSFEYLPEDDPEQMVKRVEKIGKRIIFCSEVQELKDLEWTFYVAKSDSQLALGRPGGAVLITTAMIETLESDDELANVVGHEMGHILCHHVGANLVHMALFTAANLAFDILFRSTFLLTPLFEFAWNIPFWKQSEIESDFVGLVLMSRALYDYRSAPSYFERAVQQEKESGHGPSQVYLAFSSWPSSEQRLSVLQKWQEIARRHYIESKRKLWTEKSKKAGDQSNK